jgi:hypothetical protein
MDDTQVRAFIDYMVGDRTVGSADNEEVGTPHSPELRAFVVARLGDLTPAHGYYMLPARRSNLRSKETAQAKALAGLLREVADAIDPPEVAAWTPLAQ